MDGYYGEVRIFAGNFAPRNWMLCLGQELQVTENPALFALIGNIYGGDGSTTFKLPDFTNRVPLGHGTGIDLSPNTLGEYYGDIAIEIPYNCIPPHTHAATVTPPPFTGTAKQRGYKGFAAGNTDPEGRYPGTSPATAPIYYDSENAYMRSANVEVTKSGDYSVDVENTHCGTLFEVFQPITGLNFIICVRGTWPPRN